MTRKFKSNKLLIASNNPGKAREIQELLNPFKIEVQGIQTSNIIEPEETGKTFIENAILKAQYYGKIFNLPAIADDSGLSIDALNGFPGVYSARVANGNFYEAFDIIKKQLLKKDLSSSNAHFTCALALWWPDGHIETFEGKVFGSISFPPKGNNGFGYDPIFKAEGHNKNFGEITYEEKSKISHRSIAFQQMVKNCF
ncbi:MAG: RdgB/HAM1 family non-canonical purine NTP pyrophosphatase [Pseudomonadota bacterium]